MRGWILAASVMVVACNGTARRPAGEGEARGGSSDTGVTNMNAGSLQVVSTHERVPASAVIWTAKGIVTADDDGVMFWKGNDPGAVTPFDELAFGWPRSLVDLGGGEVGVAAARVGPDGAIGTDAAALDAAIKKALSASAQAYYRITTAAWAAGGKRLWISVERKSPRRDRAPLAGDEARSRNFVLDDKLALVAESSERDLAWTRIVAAGEVVATSSSHLSLWGAGEPGKPLADWPTGGPPSGMDMSGGGTLLAFTKDDVLTVVRSDGSPVAQTALPDGGAVAMDRKGQLIAVANSHAVQLWRLDVDQLTKVAEATVPELVGALAFSPDGNGIVAGQGVRTVSILAIK
jgi:hypothetical protein